MLRTNGTLKIVLAQEACATRPSLDYSGAPGNGPWFGLSLPASPLFPNDSILSAVIADITSRALSVGCATLKVSKVRPYNLMRELRAKILLVLLSRHLEVVCLFFLALGFSFRALLLL